MDHHLGAVESLAEIIKIRVAAAAAAANAALSSPVEIWRRRPLLPPDVTDPVAIVRTPSGWWIEGPHNTVYGQESIKGGVHRPFLSRRRAYAALRRYYQQAPFD